MPTVSQLPRLEHTKPEKVELGAREYSRWQTNQTPDTLRETVDALDPVISSALTTYVGTPSPLLRSRARLLAASAIKTYDPTHKASLRSHVTLQLQPLRRYATQAAQPMKMSERHTQALYKLLNTEQELASKLGRDPSDIELADYLGWNMRAIRKARLYDGQIVSTANPDTDKNDPTLYRTDPYDVWLDFVYHDANDIDRKIMDWRLGRNGAAISNAEIAARLKISPAAVSQRIAALQAKINEGMDLARSH